MSESEGIQEIRWRDWSDDAFAAANTEDKPVLLTLGATWCHWCHVMDQTSYSDDRVIELVNSRFIPVRVDVDQRPDISLRYNQGGFPSVAFITGTGEFITGRPYTPPDEMVALLRQVASGEVVQQDLGPCAQPSAPESRNGPGSVSAVQDRLLELYDPEFGGFGMEPKQPPWEALQFLAARYSRSGDRALLDMVEATLQGMWHGIYDRKDQGFFRYSVSRDWKVPHYEKMLVSNASLGRVFLEGYQLTGKAIYRAAVEGILHYLLNTLLSPGDGMFQASQDADEPYYQSSWKDRDNSEAPPIDRTLYAGWNALAAHALLSASGVLGDARLRQTALAVIDKLWRESWTTDQGLPRRAGEPAGNTPILADQVHLLRALLSVYQETGQREYVERAVEVADTVQRIFGAPDGGCFDTVSRDSFEASILIREEPVLENAHCAEALLTLSYLTGDPRYSERADSALKIFEGVVPGRSYLGSHASRRMEEDEEALFLPAGAAWGRAKDMLAHGPVSLVLVGDSSTAAYRRLHQASLRMHAPHKIVLPLDSERDAAKIRELGFPADRPPAVYVCFEDRCLAPITTARGIREVARARPWSGGQRVAAGQ